MTTPTAPAPHKRRPLWRTAQIAILGLSVLFLGQALLRHWNGVQAAAQTLDWGQFALAAGLAFLALGTLPGATFLALRAMGTRASYTEALTAFFTSQAVKYLPGGLWSIPGRTVFYRLRYDIPAAQGMFSVLWEVMAVLVAALLVGGPGAPLPAAAPLLPLWLGAVLVGLTAAIFASQQAELWRWLAGRGFGLARGIAAHLGEVRLLPPRALLGMTLAALGFWLLLGAAFRALLGALPAAAGSIPWHEAAGIYALAWLAGFLVFVAPAGLGFRESALALLLAPWLGEGQAVFVAVLARLWWTVGEAAWIAIALLAARRALPQMKQHDRAEGDSAHGQPE